MLFDPMTIGWRHHGNCIIIMPLGHYATLLLWLRIFDTTDLYHTSVVDPGFLWGGGANPPGPQDTISPNFPKTAWNWKNLDPEGRGDAIRHWTVPKTKSFSNPVPDWMFRFQSWRIQLSVLTLFVLQRSASVFTRPASGFTRISLIKIPGHGCTSLDFSLKPFRIVFLHQFSVLSDTVTFHWYSVIEERITGNIIRLIMSW